MAARERPDLAAGSSAPLKPSAEPKAIARRRARRAFFSPGRADGWGLARDLRIKKVVAQRRRAAGCLRSPTSSGRDRRHVGRGSDDLSFSRRAIGRRTLASCQPTVGPQWSAQHAGFRSEREKSHRIARILLPGGRAFIFTGGLRPAGPPWMTRGISARSPSTTGKRQDHRPRWRPGRTYSRRDIWSTPRAGCSSPCRSIPLRLAAERPRSPVMASDVSTCGSSPTRTPQMSVSHDGSLVYRTSSGARHTRTDARVGRPPRRGESPSQTFAGRPTMCRVEPRRSSRRARSDQGDRKVWEIHYPRRTFTRLNIRWDNGSSRRGRPTVDT